MSTFTTHAIKRFVQRYVENLDGHSAVLQRELARFRRQAASSSWTWNGSEFRSIGGMAGQNYANAVLITRTEAENLIDGKLCAQPGRFYRSAGAVFGVWVVHWDGRRPERAITFLARGDSPAVEELCLDVSKA